MPKGTYARKQERSGYRDQAYWAKKLKERANFTCELCGERRPARLLKVKQIGEQRTLDAGAVLCPGCEAEEHFGTTILNIHELILKAEESGFYPTSYQLRKWARLGLIPRARWGYLPAELLSTIALLYHNQDQGPEDLRKLLREYQVKFITLKNMETGEWETMQVIEEFPGVSLDGRVYICQRLLNGDLLIRREKRGEGKNG